jgi:hypothetical protein
VKKNKSRITRHEITRLLEDADGIRKLSKFARNHIIKLVALVHKGSPEAALELFRTAAFGTGMLTCICEGESGLFTPIAQGKLSWPIMFSPHPEKVKANAEFLRRLGLGRHTQINLSAGKTFSWQVPANVVCFHLHQLAQCLRRAPSLRGALMT